jgi:hypothetical protein
MSDTVGNELILTPDDGFVELSKTFLIMHEILALEDNTECVHPYRSAKERYETNLALGWIDRPYG